METSQQNVKSDVPIESVPATKKEHLLLSSSLSTSVKPKIIQRLPNDEMMLPNMQVELARHKHMGELSTFLLKKCPSLRMPSFERWVIDSNLEEKAKRFKIEELNSCTGDFHRDPHEIRDAKWKGRLKRKRQEMKSSLEMHLTSQGKRPVTANDPVIPSMASVDDESSKRLVQEIIVEQEITENDACVLVRELCQRACQSAKHVENLSVHLGSKTSMENYINGFKRRNNTFGRIHVETVGKTSIEDDVAEENRTLSILYSRKSKGKKMKPFVAKINQTHYDKLAKMFHTNLHPSLAKRLPPDTSSWIGDNSNPIYHIFNHLVFCLLVRYSSLSGGQQLQDLRGGGMQGAIHSQVFDVLETRSCHVMECFASPLNAFTGHFCSAFHKDLDHHFGSVGDFFSIPIGFFGRTGHIHEANPPFAPGFMSVMVKRIEEHLKFADENVDKSKNKSGHLTFIIVVPSVVRKESQIHKFANESFSNMLESPYFSKQIVLKSREHGYVEGSQHLRPTRYKQSQYDTSIIILQSKTTMQCEDNEKNLRSHDFESKLKEAFSTNHQQELTERRKAHESEPNFTENVQGPLRRKKTRRGK